MSTSQPLQFAPWSSDIELSFYAALASLKINHDKLNDAARKIVGRYEVRQNDPPERSARMQIPGNALTSDDVSVSQFRAEGILKNVNTSEEYKNLDRTGIIETAGRTIWDAILDGSIYSCPSLLSSFYAIFFADLKKYKFTYHYAFPALHSDSPWEITNDLSSPSARLQGAETSLLSDAVHTWKYSVDKRQHGFFLAKRQRKPYPAEEGQRPQTDDLSKQEISDVRPSSPTSSSAEDIGFRWIVASIATYETGFFDNVDPSDRFMCFVDPSTYPRNPSWILRNFLVCIRHRWHLSDIQILCYRDTHARRDRPHSLILHLTCPISETSSMLTSKMPKITGWERNDAGKLTSRVVSLAEYLDPARLADQSVDLNLKLMKWRIAPDLDLDSIKSTRCLLLGAGTLGSYVARNLLGWGVHKITFVDNGRVSFSNPVRQPLFNFADCADGGAAKAIRAAAALREIYPGVQAEGHAISVPMAGHPVTDELRTHEEFNILKRLIDEHDAIFLLMDSRESRWLPSVMGRATGKLVMNAALGFDSYVVMRHGGQPTGGEQALGCYFCNDVVAPGDSQKDLTLDQQCTVTRPGIAAIASALLVEMLVSILQHPLRAAAPAPVSRDAPRSPSNHPLGLVPHQIRGFLASYENVLLHGPAYDCCSACSDKIVSAYKQDGWDFVRRAMNQKGFVEELSGLAEVQRRAEEASNDVDWEEDGVVDDIDGDAELL